MGDRILICRNSSDIVSAPVRNARAGSCDVSVPFRFCSDIRTVSGGVPRP